MRSIGLDIHRDFAEVAIAEGGEVRSAGRIETAPEALELFAQSLGRDDRVALEVTGNAWGIARIIEPHVARVIVVSPTDTGSAKRGRRPTASTPGPSPDCWRRARWRASGCPTRFRPPGGDRRHGAQARLPVLVPADPRGGLRLRAALADPQEDPSTRAAGWRGARQGEARDLGGEQGDA